MPRTMPGGLDKRLPRFARWLVRLGAPAPWREALIGDLEEIFQDELDAGRGRIAAARHVSWEAWRSVFGVHRLSSAFSNWLGRGPLGRRPDAPQTEPGEKMLPAVLQDFRYALRSLRRSPGFTGLVAATLALGVGCVTAFGSLFDAVLLRPLPFDEPDRLSTAIAEFLTAVAR